MNTRCQIITNNIRIFFFFKDRLLNYKATMLLYEKVKICMDVNGSIPFDIDFHLCNEFNFVRKAHKGNFMIINILMF